MRSSSVIVIAALLLVTATVAWAACPDANGIFGTTNGTLIGGRVSEAWCGAGGAPLMPGVPGNTENAMSWDGVALGTQWRLWGMQINAAGAIQTGMRVFGPYTYVDYSTDYDGGQFWLTRAGPWGDGINDLTGNVTAYHVATTITYYNGSPVGATSNATLTGYFTNCATGQGCVVEWAIANAIKIWDSGMGTMPANYPAMLCGAAGGELFDACCIQLSIHCAVPIEPTTWGAIKSMYN